MRTVPLPCLTAARAPSRRSRAFSLLEVAAAAALFAVISIGLSLAASSALASRASAAIKHRLAGEMDLALESIAYTPFEDILSNTFTPPSPCAGSALLGTRGSSCLTVADRAFEVIWSVSFAADSVAASTEAVDAASIFATVTLPDGSTLTRSRRVLAPTPGFTGDALLRVQASGEFSQIEGPLYLVEASAPSNTVATASVEGFGSALFRVPPSSCTAVAPCRLALSPSDTWSTDGTVALSPNAVFGDASLIELTPGRVHQMAAEVFVPADITVELYAATDSGSRAPAADGNTICLWASFNDGSADRLVPSCNTAANAALRFDDYAIDPLQPTWRAPFPSNVEVRFTVDHPNGSCPDLGQLGASAGLWQQAPVCTSWTWGVPSTLTLPDDSVVSFTDPVVSPPGQASFTATWEGSLARPAAGFDDRPLWANPRTYGACTTTASCTSLLTTTPEATVCPSQLCLSSRVPTLIAPTTGAISAVEVNGASTTFTVTVVDEYGDPVQVELLAAPTSGTLFFDDLPLSAGDVITTTAGPSAGSFTLTYEEDATIDVVPFMLRLTNSVPDTSKDVEVVLYRNARAWLFSTPTASLTQSSTYPVSVSLVALDSTPANGEIVSITTTGGLTAPATATADSEGKVNITLTAGNIAPGSYTLTLTATGGASTTIPVIVSQLPSDLTLTATDVDQDDTSTATITVRDPLGAVVQGASVSFATNPSGFGFLPGLRLEPSGCVTDAAGECSVSIVADLAAPAGSFTLTAKTTAATTTDAFSVTAVPSSLDPSALTLAQGDNDTWSLVLRDGSGAALVGRTVSFASAPTGLSVTPSSRVSSLGGVVSFTVTAAPSLAAGPHTVSFTADSVTLTATLAVVSIPTAFTAPASFPVVRGTLAPATVSVRDAAGSPVGDVGLVFESALGLTITATPSDSQGNITVSVAATETAAKGVRSVSFSAVGTPGLTGTLEFSVLAAPATVSLSGSVPQSGRESLTVTVLDVDGDPVEDVVVSLSGLPASLSVAARATTDSSGVANLAIADTSTTALGLYRGKLTVALDDVPRFFSVLVEVAAIASTSTAPATPPPPSATPLSSNSISLDLTAATNDGGSAVSSYRLYRDGSLVSVNAGSPVVLTGLTPATSYVFTLATCNLTGCSPRSAPRSASTYPSAPSGLAVSASGVPESLDASWSLPTGSFTSLSLRFRPVGTATYTTRVLSTTSTTYTLRSLTSGTEYEVQIGAGNAAGMAWSTTATATPSARPGAPTSFAVSLADADPSLSFTAPDANGSAIVSYRVYRDGSLVATITAPATTYLDTSAPPGARTYVLRACNAVGCSVPTAAITITVP